jgi:hypothetical protein
MPPKPCRKHPAARTVPQTPCGIRRAAYAVRHTPSGIRRAAYAVRHTPSGIHRPAYTGPPRHAVGRAARWPRFPSGPSGSAAGRPSADGSARPHLIARRRQSRGSEPQPTRFSPVYEENSPAPARLASPSAQTPPEPPARPPKPPAPPPKPPAPSPSHPLPAQAARAQATRSRAQAARSPEPQYAAAAAAGDDLDRLAGRLGTTPAALALAFPLTNPAVTSVLFGATSPPQLRANCAAAELRDRLTPDDVAELRRTGAQRPEPTAPDPEPRTPSPGPRAPDPEPRTPSPRTPSPRTPSPRARIPNSVKVAIAAETATAMVPSTLLRWAGRRSYAGGYACYAQI